MHAVLKLLVVSRFWPTKSNTITGIFVVQQAKALERQGWELTVIRPAPAFKRSSKSIDPRLLGLSPSTRFIEVPFLSLPPSRLHCSALAFNWKSCGYFVRRTVRQLAKRNHYHGILCHGLTNPIWTDLIRAPSAIVVHGIDPLYQLICHKSTWQKRLRVAWSTFDWVLLVGRALQQYARQLSVPPEKIKIIHNGTDIPTDDGGLSPQRPLTKRRVVLSVSNLIPIKGIDLNLRALAEILQEHPQIDWEYRIVGDGPEKPRLQELATHLKIQDRVVFLGRLPYSDTMSQMQQCDVFSLPSWGEAFGIVYLEAMARGRPVIGCLGWGAQEIVRHGKEGLLVEPGDVNSLKQAILKLLSDPDYAGCLGRAARLRSFAFSWEANARCILSLFRDKQPP
ncbi:Glycosyltransferase involved in cell wall bisynthesis [Desulfacinum hydrothermale DSM 13146]|uniref:Glycosyltransferase involved in cell wall bisynthesis n=2 Tax=Desulfacinum hydrothermale TaxID=109258 RepID=A0A1W1XRW3_9BACT|nr:Glycosyltransferase involved in cell wall bisynthesis [Desulfacinum hydrothermale DSM 13146]